MSPQLTVLILFLPLSAANSVEYAKLGGEVVINTGSTVDKITSITWKHGGDIAVEWFGGETYTYRQFEGCSALNTSTGALTLSNLTSNHSGRYETEINNHVLATWTEIQVISPVPKPTVSMQCDAERTRCLLTCEGNATDAEPVTYSWSIFDAVNYHKGREFNITENDHEPWFRCEMENPVSSESSERFPNPFKSRNRLFLFFLILGFIVLLIAFIIWFIYKSRKERRTRLGASSNGEARTPLSVQVTSGQTPTSSVVPLTSSQTEIINESSNQDKNTPAEPSDEPESSSVMPEELNTQVHRCSESPESSDQTATTTSEVQEASTSVPESSNETGTSTKDSEDQQTSSHDLENAASTESCDETEKSAEESNGEETTKPLLEEQN